MLVSYNYPAWRHVLLGLWTLSNSPASSACRSRGLPSRNLMEDSYSVYSKLSVMLSCTYIDKKDRRAVDCRSMLPSGPEMRSHWFSPQLWSSMTVATVWDETSQSAPSMDHSHLCQAILVAGTVCDPVIPGPILLEGMYSAQQWLWSYTLQFFCFCWTTSYLCTTPPLDCTHASACHHSRTCKACWSGRRNQANTSWLSNGLFKFCH